MPLNKIAKADLALLMFEYPAICQGFQSPARSISSLSIGTISKALTPGHPGRLFGIDLVVRQRRNNSDRSAFDLRARDPNIIGTHS